MNPGDTIRLLVSPLACRQMIRGAADDEGSRDRRPGWRARRDLHGVARQPFMRHECAVRAPACSIVSPS